MPHVKGLVPYLPARAESSQATELVGKDCYMQHGFRLQFGAGKR